MSRDLCSDCGVAKTGCKKAACPWASHPSNTDAQPTTLRCAHCREEFEPPFAEFFYRDANGPFGWRKWCKACYSEAPSIVARNRQSTGSRA